jgi:hypothetical protein
MEKDMHPRPRIPTGRSNPLSGRFEPARSLSRLGRATVSGLVAAMLALAIGCQGPNNGINGTHDPKTPGAAPTGSPPPPTARPAEPATLPAPARTPPAPAAPSPPASQAPGSEREPGAAPPVEAPAPSAAEPPQPKTPPYIVIVERFDPRRATTLTTSIQNAKAIEIKTGNVRRFRITREELPLPGGRSIPVRIDGRAFEWTPNHREVEFELTPSGAWQVAATRP